MRLYHPEEVYRVVKQAFRELVKEGKQESSQRKNRKEIMIKYQMPQRDQFNKYLLSTNICVPGTCYWVMRIEQ